MNQSECGFCCNTIMLLNSQVWVATRQLTAPFSHLYVKSEFSILKVAFKHKVSSFVIHFHNKDGKVTAVQ